MKKQFIDLASKAFLSADKYNRSNILKIVDSLNPESMLDIGCDDGVFTSECGYSSNAKHISGVEIVESAAQLAREKGVDVSITNLENILPFADGSFELVISNQVIEHVPNLDLYMSEIFRVLAPNGTAVISTENGSSWINIFASLFGWQIFSLTNISSVQSGIGNPFALHRNQNAWPPTWTHKTIFNYRGLIEFAEVHGFKVEKIHGAGYFPLPTITARLDTRHSHFITIHLTKNISRK